LGFDKVILGVVFSNSILGGSRLLFLSVRWSRICTDDDFCGQMALDLVFKIEFLAMKRWENGLAA
jgi:hypothetical protein